MLPKVIENMVEYTCLGGNHFTIFCRMCLQMIKYLSAQQEKGFCADASGALSVNVLADIDKNLATAVRQGGQYIVLSRQIYELGDQALAVIQRAENLINAIRTNESELQLMRRCCRVALDNPKILADGLEKLVESVTVDFPQIPKDHACKAAMFALHLGGITPSASPAPPSFPGGGEAGRALPYGLKPFERFCVLHEKYVPGNRRLRTPVYLELTKLSIDIPRCKVAIALTAALAPHDKVTMDGWCEFIMAADITSKRRCAAWKQQTFWIEEKTTEGEESLSKELFPSNSETSMPKLTSGDMDRIFGDAPQEKRAVLPVATQLLLLVKLMTSLVRVLLDKQHETYAYRQTLAMAWKCWHEEWSFYLKNGEFPATAGGSSPTAAGPSASNQARCFPVACVVCSSPPLCCPVYILRAPERLRRTHCTTHNITSSDCLEFSWRARAL